MLEIGRVVQTKWPTIYLHCKPDSTLPAHSLNVKCLTYNEEGQFGSLVCTNVLYEAGNWIPIVTNADNWLYSHMISGDIT